MRLSYTERAKFSQNSFAKKLFQLMDNKKTNLAFSADVTESQKLLDLVDKIGSEICVLKTHIDILEDFSKKFIVELTALAKKHHFFIFEDRKFADIGNTVKQQYAGGIYHIAEWADIVNAHVLPGPGIIHGLAEVGFKKNRGLLLLAEMSSAGHLMTADYVIETLKMAEQHPEFVIGFIAQHKLANAPEWIYMTPGIQFNENQDGLGQQYITPEKAILENGTDIIIVGRGILHASSPQQAAIAYREAGWQAYQAAIHDFN